MEKRLKESREEFGQTPADDISGLKLKSPATRKELFDAESENNLKALQKYFYEFEKIKFNYDFLVKIHFDMFCDVWQWAGKIRSRDLNLGVKPHLIRPELQKLTGDYEDWMKRKWDPVEIAATYHHRLVWIHPFENGNGRWARLIANLLLKKLIGKVIYWPEDQMFIQGGYRKQYVTALKNADQGNFTELIRMHKKILEV